MTRIAYRRTLARKPPLLLLLLSWPRRQSEALGGAAPGHTLPIHSITRCSALTPAFMFYEPLINSPGPAVKFRGFESFSVLSVNETIIRRFIGLRRTAPPPPRGEFSANGGEGAGPGRGGSSSFRQVSGQSSPPALRSACFQLLPHVGQGRATAEESV